MGCMHFLFICWWLSQCRVWHYFIWMVWDKVAIKWQNRIWDKKKKHQLISIHWLITFFDRFQKCLRLCFFFLAQWQLWRLWILIKVWMADYFSSSFSFFLAFIYFSCHLVVLCVWQIFFLELIFLYVFACHVACY